MNVDYASQTITENGQTVNRKDNNLFIFLVFCGIAGLSYFNFAVWNNAEKSALKTEKVLIQTTSIIPEEAKQDEAHAYASVKSTEELFVPNDYLEAELTAKFTLKRVSKGVAYELDLGDGNRKPFTNGALFHTYQKMGKVIVTLYGTFDGYTKKIQQRTYDVARPTEIEVAAQVVDYGNQ